MKVAISGGGSGGHTTPLVAVARALKQRHPDMDIVVFSEDMGKSRNEQLGDIRTVFIPAGKYRRYYKQSLLEKLRDFETIRLNIRDLARLTRGFIKSLRLLRAEQPDLLFVKGGYVSLPVGLAAWFLGIDYVTHDSDSIPSLTNRLLAKGATMRTSGFPYDDDAVIHVGIPVRDEFSHVTRNDARNKLKLNPETPHIVVVGGSLGAHRINEALVKILPDVIKSITVFHVAGKDNIEQVKLDTPKDPHYVVRDFAPLAEQFAAADVVVTRAGATTLAELASLNKAIIVIPNPMLTEGHQIKNGEVISEEDAGIVIDEAQLQLDPSVLLDSILTLVKRHDEQRWMGENLHRMFPRNASDVIAQHIIAIIRANKSSI